MVSSTNLKLGEVNVDFIGKYNYPLLLRKYGGYVLKEVDYIKENEVAESMSLVDMDYLPIYILNCNKTYFTKKEVENEKSQFNLKSIILEIEKDILDIKNFKGVILLDISNGIYVCSQEYKVKGDKIIIKGFLGNLQECITNSLIFYNRRLVDLW